MKNIRIWRSIISALLVLLMFVSEGYFLMSAKDDVDVELVDSFITGTVLGEAGEKLIITATPFDFDSVLVKVDPLPTEIVEFDVQRSTKKNSGFKSVDVADMGGGEFLDNGLKTGTTYFYRVRGKFNSGEPGVADFFGPFSTVVKAKPVLGKTNIYGNISYFDNCINFDLDPVSGADGFQVVYANKVSFKGSKKKELKFDSSTNTHFVGGLPGKKTYFVKVRAFRIIGKKRVYGPYSDVSSQYVDQALPNVGLTDMKVKGHTFTSPSDVASGFYRWVGFKLENKGFLMLKLSNKIYGTKNYFLANSKGKKKASISIKSGKSVAIRVAGKTKIVGIIRRKYGFENPSGNLEIPIKVKYDGGTYWLSCSYNNAEVYVFTTSPSGSFTEASR